MNVLYLTLIGIAVAQIGRFQVNVGDSYVNCDATNITITDVSNVSLTCGQYVWVNGSGSAKIGGWNLNTSGELYSFNWTDGTLSGNGSLVLFSSTTGLVGTTGLVSAAYDAKSLNTLPVIVIGGLVVIAIALLIVTIIAILIKRRSCYCSN